MAPCAAVQARAARRVCARGAGAGAVCALVIFSLSSPPLILAGEAGLPGEGGGFAHLGLRLLGGRWRQRGLQLGCCPFSVPSGRSQDLLQLFVSAVPRAKPRRVE